MRGSPIIQAANVAGAITHIPVNDPTQLMRYLLKKIEASHERLSYYLPTNLLPAPDHTFVKLSHQVVRRPDDLGCIASKLTTLLKS